MLLRSRSHPTANALYVEGAMTTFSSVFHPTKPASVKLLLPARASSERRVHRCPTSYPTSYSVPSSTVMALASATPPHGKDAGSPMS